MNISVKYLAGFLDSDGSVAVQFRKRADGRFSVQARVSFKQRADRSEVIHYLANKWGVGVYHEDAWSGVDAVVLTCNKAVRFLEQVKNHLVIKYDLAVFVLGVSGSIVDDPKVVKKQLKELRSLECSRKKTYPSRAWLAGYLDGDGSIQSLSTKDPNKFRIRLQFTSWVNDLEGLSLIQKQFGGSLYREKNCAKLYISNALSLLEYVSNHILIKRAQLQYAVEHLRRGRLVTKEFKENLSKMKMPASTK